MAMKGLLIDSSLLDTSSSIEKLLMRLGFSNLHVGLLFAAGHNPSEKEGLLKKWGLSEAVKVVVVPKDEDVVGVIHKTWPVQASLSVFVTPSDHGSVTTTLAESGWNIVFAGQAGTIKAAPVIEQIDDVFAAIASLNKKALGDELLVVGHVMKWSREKDFLKRRALPVVPTSNVVAFVALQTEKALETQLAGVDMVLHKATDEIVSVATIQDSSPADRIQYSDAIQNLQRYLAKHPEMCVVDPISRLNPLLDRALTRELLEDLEDAKVSNTTVVRAPRSVEVKDLEEPHLSAAVSVGFPTIVKTMMACGTADAHTMAVVFKKEGYVNLQVPLPAVVQVLHSN